MILITGTFRIPPGNVAAARPEMERMIAESRSEDGCLHYSYAKDILEPGLIRVTELWRDQAVLDAHAASDHLAAWRESWESLQIGDRSLSAYEVAEPRPI